jgi:catechol 2,3-dioxygenase-like lactoylglutathione lyase family enzyme
MIEPLNVVHFAIPVSDLVASRKFYTEILGLTLVHDAPYINMVFLRAGPNHVILAKSDGSLKRDPKDARRAHHAFKVAPEKYDDAKNSSPRKASRFSRKRTARKACSSAVNSTCEIRTAR